MHRFLQAFLGPDAALDLGTAATRLGAAGEGVVLEEPSVVATDRASGRVLAGGAAVGRLALEMKGRTPDAIRVASPLEDGAIADYAACEAMLRQFFRKALRGGLLLGPRVLVAVPGRISPVQRRALFGAAHRAGARQVLLMAKSKAAAIGAGLPMAEPGANLLCDMGEGVTEIAVISFADQVATRSIRTAGGAMTRAIVEHLKLRYSLRVGEAAAERLKHEIGAAFPLEDELVGEVDGLDVVSGLPRTATITSEEVREALAGPLDEIVAAIQSILERLSPDMASDLVQRGMVLGGGGAFLRKLDVYFRERLNVPVRVASSPDTVVIRGLVGCLEHLDRWRPVLERSDDA